MRLKPTVLTDENVAEAKAVFENGKWIVDSEDSVFSYEAKAGDRLRVSTNSDIEWVYIEADLHIIVLDQYNKSAMINITSDTTLDVMVLLMDAESQVELEFTLIRERAVDGETEKHCILLNNVNHISAKQQLVKMHLKELTQRQRLKFLAVN